MKEILSEYDIYTTLKYFVFNSDKKIEKDVKKLFELAKIQNDLETIENLAFKFHFEEAILFLNNSKLEVFNLIELIENGSDFDEIKNAISVGSYIHQKNKIGNSVLVIAAITNQIDIVRILLENGANVFDKFKGEDVLTKKIFDLGYSEILDLLIHFGANNILNEYANEFFYKIDKVIKSKFIAEQFIYEELEAASYGNDEAKQFVEKSGVDKLYYINAMKNSLPEVDGSFENPQQMLHLLSFQIKNSRNENLLVSIRLLVVDKIMKKWRIGKYKESIIKYTLENNIEIDKYEDYILIENEKFFFLAENKFYNQKRKMYLNFLNKAVVFSNIVYDTEKKKEEYFKIISEKMILPNNFVHNPKKLVDILSKFSSSENLKYTNHTWDSNLKYEDFINKLKINWNEIEKDLKILSEDLYYEIEKFLFCNKLGQRDQNNELIYWGENFTIGWSSEEIMKYAKDGGNPEDYVITNQINEELRTFKDIMEKFKSLIVIKQDDKNLKLFKKFLDIKKKYKDLEIDINDLKENKIDKFFIDVFKMESALKIIFEDISKISEENKKVKVLVNEDDNYIELKIIHINSNSSKTLKQQREVIIKNGGNFKTIYNKLISVCDWSIDVVCRDNKRYIINYLDPKIENNECTYKQIEDINEGFTHILRFYK